MTAAETNRRRPAETANRVRRATSSLESWIGDAAGSSQEPDEGQSMSRFAIGSLKTRA